MRIHRRKIGDPISINRSYAIQPRPRDAGISIPVARVLLSRTPSRGHGGFLYRAVAVVEDEAGGRRK
jgi:hypothetical protein